MSEQNCLGCYFGKAGQASEYFCRLHPEPKPVRPDHWYGQYKRWADGVTENALKRDPA